MVSYFSLMKVLLRSHVDLKWGKAFLCPAFMGRLSPALYRLVVPARLAENGQNLGIYQNLGVRLKSTYFCQTTAVSISAHSRQIKKLKNTNTHYHYPISVFILTTSKSEAVLEIHHCGLKLLK
jgi:hypothetical protein